MALYNADALFARLADSFGLQQQSVEELVAIADAIRGSLFKQQRDLLTDPHRRKAALCPRRAGKSYVAMSYAFDVCLRKPNAKVAIINVSLKVGRRNYWDEIIPTLIHQFGIPCKPFQNELRLVLKNGSMIYILGADKRDAIEDIRGTQFDLAIVDECKSYPTFILKELIDEVLGKTLADRKGTMLLIGTPGSMFQGPFFEATYPGHVTKTGTGSRAKERLTSRSSAEPERFWLEHPNLRPLWSRHSWLVTDNVSMVEPDGTNRLWNEAMQEKEDKGWADDEPIFLRESLGQWVVGTDAFVYAYANLGGSDPERVHWTPDYVNGNQWGLVPATDDWRYLLGVDLGYEDAFALVVGAYNKHDNKLYHVWEDQETHLDVIDCANRICKAIERFGRFDAIVIDSGALGKQISETFRRRYPIPAKDAEKARKFEFIEFMNADFRAGRVKVLPKSGLAMQLSTLQLDLGSGKKKEELARTERLRENRTQANHLCDAWLYLWRYSYHYYRRDRITLEEPGTPEYELAMRRAEMNKYAAAKRDDAANSRPWQSWTANRDPLSEYKFGRN